jgi:[NiFe] hydrogenase assembly HybE family chaperone
MADRGFSRPDAALADRVRALEALFTGIWRVRMAGMPLVHPRLSVRAVGFERELDEPGLACGVLVTPWSMNLVRLPLNLDAAGRLPPTGAKQTAEMGGLELEFIGAEEPGFGPWAQCSLFSPMSEFADQPGAVATARAVLDNLRHPPAAATAGAAAAASRHTNGATTDRGAAPTPADGPARHAGSAPAASTCVEAVPMAAASATDRPLADAPTRPAPAALRPAPARRGFLFGRSAAGARR